MNEIVANETMKLLSSCHFILPIYLAWKKEIDKLNNMGDIVECESDTKREGWEAFGDGWQESFALHLFSIPI